MSTDKQHLNMLTTKDTRIIAFWKMVEYSGLVLFFAVIPRSLGAEEYGDFAIILSVMSILLLSSAFGGAAMFGRFVPGYITEEQPQKVNGLFTQLFVFRMFFALLVAILVPVLLAWLRPDMSSEILLAVAVAYFCGTVSMSCFHLFFGLNRMGKWMFHDSSSRMLLVLLSLVYWQEINLKSVVYSLATIEIMLACISVFFARHSFSMSAAIQQLSAFSLHIKFGLAYVASAVLLIVVWRGGEIIIVWLSDDIEQVAFFNIANSIFLTFNALFAQIGTIMIPSVSVLNASGQHEKKSRWLGAMLKYTTVTTLLTLIVINAIGEQVLNMLLGEGFNEVIVNLVIISVSLVPLCIVRLGLTTAVVHDKLRENFLMAVVMVVTFLVSAIILTPEMGARGASISVVVSSFMAAAFAYWHFQLSSITKVAKYSKVVLLGGVFVVFIAFSGYPEIVTGIVSIILFTGMLLMSHVIQISELLALVSARKK